ncbi:enoyl-CoA-hydratase (plasmid) [Antarctobacter heliothermus]|uniref:Enoyl-CoA-hydratase n=1 Tax=Antarctobacter heliothermus TaxID=74033 RepID=A0A222EBC0_9RHOB|nr:enoyl-CoA hydratase/isomerase family protein [Antarctobacter heliothermus]ASP23485.1 enoyl-CoA-hydratase [Antarctobacter heliothermus]
MAIEFTVDNAGIATLTINRPDRMNALDQVHYAELSRLWIEVRDNPAIRCAIITGTGDKSFCAGADIKEVLGDKIALHDLWQTQKQPLLNRGLEIWKPVIAAVNGYCLGGGMTLLLSTDIRIAATGATFAVGEVKRGIVAGMGGTQRLIRQVTHARAMEMLLTGDSIDATTAEHWGLINRVVPETDLMRTAQDFALRIAGNAPLAVRATKELALRARDMSLADGMRTEQMMNTLLQNTSSDMQEGRAAFLEKRPPRFTGA